MSIFDIVVLAAYRNFMNRGNGSLGAPVDELHRKYGRDRVAAISEI